MAATIKLSTLKAATNSVKWPGAGLCAKWVRLVFEKTGVKAHYGNAEDHVGECATMSVDKLQPGMIVVVDDSPTSTYGHIGIYLGNNIVKDSVSTGVREISLGSWVSYNSHKSPVMCGWFGDTKVVDDTTTSGGFDMSNISTLKKGSKSKQVGCLQSILNGAHGFKLDVDNSYGPKTKAAVTSYQKANGLSQDGICGPKTWASLFGV